LQILQSSPLLFLLKPKMDLIPRGLLKNLSFLFCNNKCFSFHNLKGWRNFRRGNSDRNCLLIVFYGLKWMERKTWYLRNFHVMHICVQGGTDPISPPLCQQKWRVYPQSQNQGTDTYPSLCRKLDWTRMTHVPFLHCPSSTYPNCVTMNRCARH